MLFSIISILTACALYTTAIWSEQFRGWLMRWMVVLFALGFLFDCMGTWLMIVHVINDGLPLTIHSYSGIAALAIMLVHFIWAASAEKSGWSASDLFNRFSPYAWCLWMTAFLSGVPALTERLWLVPIVVWCLFTYLSAIAQYVQCDVRTPFAPLANFTRFIVERRHRPVMTAALTVTWLITAPIISVIWSIFVGAAYVFVSFVER